MLKTRIGLLYGILVVLLLGMGIWWIFFLTSEVRLLSDFRKQKLANDRIHASFLIQSEPEVRRDPDRWLGDSFPHLIFRKTPDGVDVEIDPVELEAVDREARNKRNMFIYEGFFFLILLAAGATVLIQSWRSEMKFKATRELFLAGATHEFKTPLASLRLYTETLDRSELAQEDRVRIRQRMVEDVERLESLVDDVLSMSAGDSFDKGPEIRMDLADECRVVVEELQSFAADRRAEIRLELEPDAVILGRRVTLTLALRNLLVNAIKHCPEPVTVIVKVMRGDRKHRLSVQDNGPGIPRRLQGKVFECFFTGNRTGRRRGAGVGLYLVSRNVEKLGGRVELFSEEGDGARFTLVLPAARTTG